MGWFKRLFGEGKIRAELTFSDGTSGVAKMPYEGDISTLDENELKLYVANYCLVEYGKTLTKMQIIGIY